MACLKLLYELEIIELRRELRERGLKNGGKKETLQARLREDIVEEGEDPDTYLFEIKPTLGEVFNSLQQKLDDMSMTLKRDSEEFCTELKKMCTSTKKVVSPVVKTMGIVEETPCNQRDSKDEEATTSLSIELLPTQSLEAISSNNGDADERGAACESESIEYRHEEPKETDEETRVVAHSLTETCAADVPDMPSSNSKTDQVNAESASKPVAERRLQVESYRRRLDPTNVCPDAKLSERSPGGDHEKPLKPDEVFERHLHVQRYQPGPYPADVGQVAQTEEESPDSGQENPRKPGVEVDGHWNDESHRQGLKPTDIWPAAETIERGPDGGEESRMEPEAKDEGPLHEECYKTAPLACPPDKAEDDDLSNNFPSCGLETHPSPYHQSPTKSPLLPTILVSPALKSYTSPCVKWLTTVTNDKRAMLPPRHCNKREINWKKRRRRRLRSPTCMVMQPEDHCSHMKTNWRRRRRRRLLMNATWMAMQTQSRCYQMKANWRRRRKRLLSSTWTVMQPQRQCSQVKANWRRRRKRSLLDVTWRAPSSSSKPTATDRPPPTSMKLHSQCHVDESVRDGQI